MSKREPISIDKRSYTSQFLDLTVLSILVGYSYQACILLTVYCCHDVAVLAICYSHFKVCSIHLVLVKRTTFSDANQLCMWYKWVLYVYLSRLSRQHKQAIIFHLFITILNVCCVLLLVILLCLFLFIVSICFPLSSHRFS